MSKGNNPDRDQVDLCTASSLSGNQSYMFPSVSRSPADVILTLYEVTSSETHVFPPRTRTSLCRLDLTLTFCIPPHIIIFESEVPLVIWNVQFDIRNLCSLVILLLHHGTPHVRSFIHGPTFQPLPLLCPMTHSAPCVLSLHTQFPGSLRQEVLQLQLSAKVSLKGNSSDL